MWVFLRDILPRSDHPQSILWRVDISTALAYVKNVGGSVDPGMLPVASKILVLAHQLHLRILPVYIPSLLNLQADAASRFRDLPDWHLLPKILHRMMKKFGHLSIVLFASRLSSQTVRFFSWSADDAPEAVDALVGLSSSLPFSPISSPQESGEEVGVIKGDLPACDPVLGSPDVVPSPAGPSNH